MHTVKNKIIVTGIRDHSKIMATKNSKEPIVSCHKLNVSSCRVVTILLIRPLMELAKIIPQLLIPKR